MSCGNDIYGEANCGGGDNTSGNPPSGGDLTDLENKTQNQSAVAGETDFSGDLTIGATDPADDHSLTIGNPVSTSSSITLESSSPINPKTTLLNYTGGFRVINGSVADASSKPFISHSNGLLRLGQFDTHTLAIGQGGNLLDIQLYGEIKLLGDTNTGIIKPDTNNLYDVGTNSFKYKDAYFSGNVNSTNITTLANDVNTNTDNLVNVNNQLYPSSGVKTGLAISQDSGTTFAVSAGVANIYFNGVFTKIDYAGEAGRSTAGEGTNYIYLDATGTLVISLTEPTSENRREWAILGGVVVSAGSIVSFGNTPVPLDNINNQMRELTKAIGIFNQTGNIISANGANTGLDKSIGTIFAQGSNFQNDVNNPSTVSLAQIILATQLRFTQTGLKSSGTNLESGNYDVGGTVTAIGGGANQWTIFRVYSSIVNDIVVEFGQFIYGSKEDALSAVSTEAHISSLSSGALLRAFIIVRNGTGDLTLADNQFIEANRFGESPSSSGGVSSTLQMGLAIRDTAYDIYNSTSITTFSAIKMSTINKDPLGLFTINVNNSITIPASPTFNRIRLVGYFHLSGTDPNGMRKIALTKNIIYNTGTLAQQGTISYLTTDLTCNTMSAGTNGGATEQITMEVSSRIIEIVGSETFQLSAYQNSGNQQALGYAYMSYEAWSV